MLLSKGDVVEMRKQHPCGSKEWTVVFVGSDIKMKCRKCDHVVMLDRPTFEKRVRKLVSHAEAPEGENKDGVPE